ncbi:MAG TPA: glycosyltransferase family 4 protein [Thermoplasmata archaeon]|nr:glycosyltransferase family 4 protein [Thermoplasmata archaeon]
MRVAQLATRYPPAPGGVERHVAEIAARLGARGHEVDVYTSELYREYPWQKLPADVPREEVQPFGAVHRLAAWSLPGEAHYTFFRGLDRALEQRRPEVLHVHTYGTHQVTVASRFRRHVGTPFVLTAHYHPPWSIEGGWWRRRLRGFYDRVLASGVLEGAARIIVQTPEEEELLGGLGIDLPPVAIVPPGYTPLPDPPPGPSPFRREFGIDGPFLLFVGRLASNKGLLPLLEAFAPLARRDPLATLVLLGEDGGMARQVDVKARALGVSERVRRIGHVPDDRLLAAAYHDARALVLPSDYEAFGLVLLEAMGQGTPVIASRVGGIPEIVDDGRTGLLVPPGAPGALGEAIARLWDDPELGRRMGEAGRTTVVPRYTWEAVAGELERLYREVVGG